MSTINGGGPANEMSLRAYFAAHALQGMLSHPCNTPIPEIVTTSVEIADAMIAALERKA